MGASLSTLRTRVREFIHQEDPTTSMFTNSLITNVLNDSIKKRWNQLDRAHEGRFVQVATIDIVADQARYSWPTGFQRHLKLEYETTDGTLIPLMRDERHTSSINPDTSYPYGSTCPYTFKPLGGGFMLEPTPQTATGSLRIEYVAAPPDLSADGDEISDDFPSIFNPLIILDTVVALLDSTTQLEDGVVKAVLRAREEWAREWMQYINRLITSNNEIGQWSSHYPDA